jgi:hypothetical protein
VGWAGDHGGRCTVALAVANHAAKSAAPAAALEQHGELALAQITGM